MTYIIFGVSYVLSFVTSRINGLLGRVRSESGQDLIEYALLGSLIAAAIIAVGAAIYTGAITSMANGISNCIDFNNDPSSDCNPI